MNILFLTDNFPPEVNAPATRGYEHCLEWLRLGAKVTVITCAPNFPQGRVYPGYKNRVYAREDMDGIRVIRVWTYITANAGFAKRSLDYLSFGLSAALAGLGHKPDLILTTSPQFFTNLAGYFLSRVKRRPWVFELRDLWPESIRTVGAMEQSRVLDFLEKMELFFYRKASRVVAVSPAFKRNLVARGIAPDKIDVIPNGANLELYAGQDKDAGLVAELGLHGKFVVAYIGTHGLAHGLDFIIRSIAGPDNPRIHFLFIGDGAQKQNVMDLARDLGVVNATFLPPVPKTQVCRHLSVCDAALVPLIKSDTFKTVIPSKIFEAAAMGKPILLGVQGQAQEIVQEHDAGVCFEPENQQDFLHKLELLATDQDLYKRLQQGCARLARAYDRKKLAGEMYAVLKAVGR